MWMRKRASVFLCPLTMFSMRYVVEPVGADTFQFGLA
jgi:hypothetical protein